VRHEFRIYFFPFAFFENKSIFLKIEMRSREGLFENRDEKRLDL